MFAQTKDALRAGVLGFAGLSGPLLVGCGKEAPPPILAKAQEVTSLNLREGDIRALGNDLYLFNPAKSISQAVEFPEKLRTFITLHPELRITSISPSDPETATFQGYNSNPVSLSYLVAVEARNPENHEKDRVITFPSLNFAKNVEQFIKDNPDYGIGPSAPTAPQFSLVGGKSRRIELKETGFVVVVRDRSGIAPHFRE